MYQPAIPIVMDHHVFILLQNDNIMNDITYSSLVDDINYTDKFAFVWAI